MRTNTLVWLVIALIVVLIGWWWLEMQTDKGTVSATELRLIVETEVLDGGKANIPPAEQVYVKAK